MHALHNFPGVAPLARTKLRDHARTAKVHLAGNLPDQRRRTGDNGCNAKRMLQELFEKNGADHLCPKFWGAGKVLSRRCLASDLLPRFDRSAGAARTLSFPEEAFWSYNVYMSEGARSDHNLMTVKETAMYLRMPEPTVYYHLKRGQLPAVQIGGRWRVKRDLIDRDILRVEETSESKAQPAILVIDDEPVVQETFKLFLRKQNFARQIAGTGKEALAALRKRSFDLCFLDLQLPEMTGDEVYAAFKELRPEMPIVVITGYPDSSMLDNILRFGPVTVLKKPLKLEELEAALRLLVKTGRQKILRKAA